MQIILYNRLPLPIAILMVVCSFCMTQAVALAEDKLPTIMEHWRAQVRTDKTAEALPIAKEITEYFDKKYPSLSGRLYLEKSNEVTTVHWFADYQDLASFRRINTELGSDEEFRAIWRKIISFIVEGTIQQTLLTPVAFFDQDKLVADLSKGQEGKIYFTSINLGSFRDRLAGEGQSMPVNISGTLKIP